MWEHYFDGVLIQTLQGIKDDQSTSLGIHFCDFKDNGQYICIGNTNNKRLTGSTLLTVYGSFVFLFWNKIYNFWIDDHCSRFCSVSTQNILYILQDKVSCLLIYNIIFNFTCTEPDGKPVFESEQYYDITNTPECICTISISQHSFCGFRHNKK